MIKIRMLRKGSPVTQFVKIGCGLMLLLMVGGCGERSDDPAQALAIVNGKTITLSEFELRWSQLPEYVRKNYVGPEGRKKFLNELIDREMLLQEAKKRGIDRDRNLLERVERFKEHTMLEALRREAVDSQVTVTPEELQGYYDTHRDSFLASEEFRVSHILVRTAAEASILKKRSTQGEDFSSLARKASLDVSTKSNGGDLGLIKKGQTVPEFEQAVLKLKPGEVSEPVATQFGYHLIKLIERRPGPALSFEEAKAQVKEHILIEKKRTRLDEFIASLRANAKAKSQLRVSDSPVQDLNTAVPNPKADAR
jgi:peptidyl-prolyl cis-trans isomerase C